jgi:hypothetical protein
MQNGGGEGMIKKGTQIAYVPDHANNDLKHKDVEFGFVMSGPIIAGMVFCRFWYRGRPGKLRTVSNSEMTSIKHIVEVKSVHPDVVDATIKLIEEAR